MLPSLVLAISLSGGFSGTPTVRQPERRVEPPNFNAFRRQHLRQLGLLRESIEEQVAWIEQNMRFTADLMAPANAEFMTPELTDAAQQLLRRSQLTLKRL